MSTPAALRRCSHCLLDVGPRGTRRVLDGEAHEFCCYGCCLAYQINHGNPVEAEATWLLVRLGVGAFLAMNIKLLSLLIYSGTFAVEGAELLALIHLVLLLLTTPLLVVLGWPFLRDAVQEARQRRLTANILLLIGVAGAYGYSLRSVLDGGGDVYFDTVALLLVLFTLGRYLEANARARAIRSLAPLLEAETRPVTVVTAAGDRQAPLGTLSAGILVRVLPGERIPVDGTVEAGHSSVDEAILTGEAGPVDKGPGAVVISGSINHTSPLLIRSTAPGSAGRWAGISRSVRDALARRSPEQRLADRIAVGFVPLVLVLAAATVLWWAARLPPGEALLAGLSVLVVACPCALGLAAPLAATLGIGRLAEGGVLIRGAEVLERLARIGLVAFDKTGTLTAGKLRLTGVQGAPGVPETAILTRAAALAAGSLHPLARAIHAAATERGLALDAVQGNATIAGQGLMATLDGIPVAVGNQALMADLGWSFPPALRGLEGASQTLVHVGWNGAVQGTLFLEDGLLREAPEVIAALRRAGLRCVLLTGDRPAAALRVARPLALDGWRARLTPEGKAAAVAVLSRRHGPVLMVGDGLNDGPVLATAAVGVAVGTATDLARESADLTLPPGGLRLLPPSLSFARRVRRTVLANLAWAFGYNVLALSLAALGLLTPLLAAVFMSASSLVVVANSLRLERGFPLHDGVRGSFPVVADAGVPPVEDAPAPYGGRG